MVRSVNEGSGLQSLVSDAKAQSESAGVSETGVTFSESAKRKIETETETRECTDFDVEAYIAELRRAEGDEEMLSIETKGKFHESRFNLSHEQLALIERNKLEATKRKAKMMQERIEANRNEALR